MTSTELSARSGLRIRRFRFLCSHFPRRPGCRSACSRSGDLPVAPKALSMIIPLEPVVEMMPCVA